MGTYGLTIITSLKVARRIGLALLVGTLSIATIQPAAAGFHYVGPQAGPSAPMTAAAASAPIGLLPRAMPQSPQQSAQTGVVQGFASQVPLTVALRQVLPRGTAFHINNDVDTSTQVSWKGGRPWQQTLDDMLAGSGLQASYGQNGVTVQRGAMVMGGAMGETAPAGMTATPITLTPPPETGAAGNNFAAPAYAAGETTMQPLDVSPAPVAEPYTPPYTPPVVHAMPAMEPALQADNKPQPYVTPAAMGVAAMMPNTSGMIGSVQQPVQNTAGALPEGTVDELPQQTVPGTSIGGMPDMQTSAFNPLNPGPADAQPSLAGTAAETWEAHSGQSLHEVLVAWAERAGIELNWVSEYDYPIQASITFNGSFEEATRTLLGGFVNASPQPIGRLHRNEQLGQQALVIETRGNQYDE